MFKLLLHRCTLQFDSALDYS